MMFNLPDMQDKQSDADDQTALDPDWKDCLARPISLPRTLNFSRGSSREIFVKQQKETIELLFCDTNTAAQAILT